MSFELIRSEFSLANEIISALRNQIVNSALDGPYYSYVKEILKGLINKLNRFIIRLYRLQRKSCVNSESLHKNVKNCLSLFEEFVNSIKNANIKALAHFDEHIMQLSEKYAKLLLFQARGCDSQMIECEKKLAVFLNGLLPTHTLLQIIYHKHSPTILIRFLANSDGKPVTSKESERSQQRRNSICQSHEKSEETENYGNRVPFFANVPETPPKCRHQPVCDEVSTVRGNMPLLRRRLFPALSSCRPVPTIIGKWTVLQQHPDSCFYDNFPCGHCQTLFTHNFIQRKSPKRPCPAVFVVTDSHYSLAKKMKNDTVA